MVELQYVKDLARNAAFELIDGKWFADRQAFVFYELPVDYQDVGDDKASVNVYTTGGNRGDFERTDQLTVEVYAPGTDAVDVLEAISDVLVADGDDHDLVAGYVDNIRCTTTPYDSPFQSDINKARAIFQVTHREQ